MIHAGKYRYLVTVQRQSEGTDSTGNQLLTWTQFAQVYAWIEPYVTSSRAGREEFKFEQLVELTYTRIHLRYLKGLTPKDQIVFENRVFDIITVNTKDERKREMELIAKERQ